MAGEELKNSALERQTFEPGSVLIKEGDVGDEAYLIEEGSVAVFRELAGQRVRIGRVGAGGMIGEMALIDSAPRMASAVAEKRVTVRVVPRRVIESELKRADPLVRAMVTTLVQNVRFLTIKTLTNQALKGGKR